ncbi:phosphotransferase [Alkalihalobacillus alcalophilus ATCC 27647 = CGMCC 1.3604]|uniref:Putative pyruvate, phosphate dikinase regulatory protein n=1 Tax=Alkalihalobacillus alcalophilus ATCC 27647 = CGMCC 1.3604 TaxID=1218173 RepID=A0A094WS65_ALKAL|nr:pyruvate, water dikinase regulatory protein [Alkalihalobacillus alcalophilus]KGA98893.1 phosphotransferase [Alkalihalobacillus alcalophilus ATCC 27647 = CGMCC 1.3604]MED1560531.1 kinase/pyrophosphorylase [Alkalihalobacillus alcalophilus]THG88879.1 phosphotransferase [Alkalihalobacillus alcalophilus ATCC 27647 = CGMCC 1.3604]
MDKPAMVYLLSDSVGETAEYVIKAVATQFRSPFEIKRFPYIKSIKDIEQAILMAKENSAIVAYTLVVPDLKEYIDQKSYEYGVEAVDLLEPLLNAFKKKTEEEPINEPMLMRKLDKKYFRKVEAIEFAVKYDDAKDAEGIMLADLVLIGVSRTSKTPLSMYLANKGYKVANIPLIPEVPVPEQLMNVSKKRCVGLIIRPDTLNEIRKERLKSLGITSDTAYVNLQRIFNELDYAEGIMKRIGCPIIDVSNKAVEETADYIMKVLNIERRI